MELGREKGFDASIFANDIYIYIAGETYELGDVFIGVIYPCSREARTGTFTSLISVALYDDS